MIKIIKNNFSISLKISLLVMFVSLIGIGILSYISFERAKKIFIENSQNVLNQDLKEYTNFIKNRINKLLYDIKIFSLNPSTQGYIRAYVSKYKYDEKTNKTFNQYQRELKSIISLILKQNPTYFQIRIIDAKNGDELLKLVKMGQKIINIADEDLQNKWNTEYVQYSLKLKKTDTYISKINLNREFNTIEFPIKPTIRVAKALYLNNQKVAISVINANIKKLFKFDRLRMRKEIKTFIANSDGYYIFNETNPQKEFGFEFGREYKITDDYPFLKPLFNSKKTKVTAVKDNLILVARKIYYAPDKFLVILKITTPSIFEEKSDEYIQTLIIAVLLIVLVISILTTILVREVTKPIIKLTNIANKIAKTKGEEQINIDINTNDEIGKLAKSFKVMLDSLIESKKEIENFANKLEKEVEKKTKELKEVNKNLEKMVKKQVEEIRKKEQALTQQSKLAAMGEMIGAIAHQWRQPLNALAINIQLLEDLYEDGVLDSKTLKELVQKNMETIQFMSNTIDDFRNFFRKDKEKVEFDIKEAIEKTIELQKAQLSNHNIKIITNLEPIIKFKGYKNEFMQVILNLISNAKDAIVEKNREGVIKISSKKEEDKIIIEIEDNGGGIPENLIDRIFEPYFTTKEEGKGTGMGLYMVREIINRMNGKISVTNTKEGAKFTIILKENSES
ncbi:MAG TPA: HAMP domain-containing protein [Candidatus Pacebacteria bacterium]|nr:HAMP domain-containing protein [Candidatus Paceibacterota bacterium]